MHKIEPQVHVTFTRVIFLTQKWTLHNYLAYLELNDDPNLHFNSNQFSPLCDSAIKLSFCLYPRGEKEENRDIVSIYPSFLSDAKHENCDVYVKISILDTSGVPTNTKSNYKLVTKLQL